MVIIGILFYVNKMKYKNKYHTKVNIAMILQ
jgi:hypothetical protein